MTKGENLLQDNDLDMVAGGVHHRHKPSLEDKAKERMRKRQGLKNEESSIESELLKLTQRKN